MKLFPLFLAQLTALGQPAVYVNSLATLDARRPIANETVYVKGATNAGDWGGRVLPFVYFPSSTNATDIFCRTPSTGVGRYIYDWQGDVRDFGGVWSVNLHRP